jgi:thiol-disulfide isomerase/thioredoxin
MLSWTVSGCARLCALALLAAGLASAPRAGHADGRATAENLDGKAVDPFAESQGRPVVLLFVRSDCPISNRYAPLLEKISEKYGGTARFWLVYPDRSESSARIRSHLQEYAYSIPALRDPRHALVERASATITPEAAVFDRAGKLVYHGRIDNRYEDFGRSRPAASTHELEDAIAAAIKGSAPASGHASAVGCYIADLR